MSRVLIVSILLVGAFGMGAIATFFGYLERSDQTGAFDVDARVSSVEKQTCGEYNDLPCWLVYFEMPVKSGGTRTERWMFYRRTPEIGETLRVRRNPFTGAGIPAELYRRQGYEATAVAGFGAVILFGTAGYMMFARLAFQQSPPRDR